MCTVFGLIPVVQVVVPSYQQFIAGSIVSQSIRVLASSVSAGFHIQSGSRHDHSIRSIGPLGHVGRRGQVRLRPVLHAGKMRGRKSNVIRDGRKLRGRAQVSTPRRKAIGRRWVAGRRARVRRRGHGAGAGVTGAGELSPTEPRRSACRSCSPHRSSILRNSPRGCAVTDSARHRRE